MSLGAEQIAEYREKGHLTVSDVFPHNRVDAAIADAETWSRELLAAMPEADKAWYLDGNVGSDAVLRKIDQPVFHREVFRRLARDPALVAMVEDLIGPELSVYFSQVFMKPARGGGPKPAHQDNAYFGPNDIEGLVSVWVALDDADEGNGCLFYADGSHREPVHEHITPEGEPFNLQLTEAILATYSMTATPVPKGGVSFHHGNVFHQSSTNRSERPRRAVAMHYVNGTTIFDHPAWPFDAGMVVKI
jgi:ectoine hydroxylase-related dioxygenase (phytanoyl-CoA dioxygenase family)